MAKKDKGKEEIMKGIKEMSSKEVIDRTADEDTHDLTIFTNEPTVIDTPLGEVAITPWTLGEYAQVGGIVESMLADFETAGIDSALLFARQASWIYYEQVLKPAAEGISIDPDIEAIYGEAVYKEQAAVTRLFARAALPALAIIKHSCGFTQEEVESLSADEGLGIFSVIILKNASVLGKAYELFGKHLS